MKQKSDKFGDITPTEFEKHVKFLFERFDRQIKNFEVFHDVKEKTFDGEYQIDLST